MIALSVMLLAAAIAGWLAVAGAPPDTRNYVRFACVLYAALAVSSVAGSQLAFSVILIVTACGPVFLACAARVVFRGSAPLPWIVSLVAVACVAGLVAAATGIAVFAFAPLLFSVLAIIAMSLRRFGDLRVRAIQAIAAASALLAGASAFAAGGTRAEPALILFSAAGLLGISLALAPRSNAIIEQERAPDLRGVAIRQPR